MTSFQSVRGKRIDFHEVRVVRDRTGFGISPEEFCSIDSQQIDARINWRRKIVPFTQLLRVRDAKVLLPAFDKKLRMRSSNEQWLRINAREQFSCLPRRNAKHRVDDRSLPFRRKLYRFVDCCVLSGFEKEELI